MTRQAPSQSRLAPPALSSREYARGRSADDRPAPTGLRARPISLGWRWQTSDGAAILLVSAPGTPRAPSKFGWWDAVFLFYLL
jgi:hypothetical protein